MANTIIGNIGNITFAKKYGLSFDLQKGFLARRNFQQK